jgi:hypothetical protein
MKRSSSRAGVFPSYRPYASPSGGRRRRAIPDRIARYYLPLSVLNATNAVMRRCGAQRRECYVWWGGYFAGEEAQVVTALWPDIPTEFGHVHLDTRQLGAMHQRLRDLDQVVLAELHTHPPGGGGQNDVDAANPATTYRGFISIVVPDFAAPWLHDLRTTHVYEYQADGVWRDMSRAEIAERFVIEEPFTEVRT